ncbi:MAG: hypothetical protein MUC36_01215 [Planctomycetes bacterium]|nr:hypothetical protein [Planctomycetota bacterium]
MALGWSRANFNGAPIPVSLAPIGMPGCDLLHSADLGAGFGTTPVGAGGLQYELALPNLTVALG